MEVINEKENKLFNRKEIQINVEAEVTPSHEESKKLISEKFSTQPENIRIKKIAGKFGSKVFEISANIYSSEEEKNKIEIFSKKQKEKLAEQEKKLEPEKKQEPSVETPAETPAEEKTKEAPAKQEEIKEEKPTEENETQNN